MKTKLLLLIVNLMITQIIVAQSTSEHDKLMAKAREIHKSVITIDTHDDFNVRNFTSEVNYTQNLDTQLNLPKMDEGGLDVSWLIVYTGQDELSTAGFEKAYKNAMDKFDAIHRLVNDYAPERIELALNSADVKRIHASGKKVAMIGVENAYPMGLDLGNVKKFHDLGARYMSLAHNGHSQFSDSNTGEADGVWLHNGLSDLGKKAIEEMNRHGIMIDLSHPSKAANIEMIQLSKAPVIASHSSARAVNNVSRNLDDEVLKMIKKNGGVVQAVALASYVNSKKDSLYEAALNKLYREIAEEMGVKYYTKWEAWNLPEAESKAFKANFQKIKEIASKNEAAIKAQFPPVAVADFVDHIDYMVGLIGINHVGISSDFDGGGGIEGWKDATETLNVTVELVKRGYNEKQIAKLWGLNLLRVLDEVQAISAKIQEKEK